MLKLVHSGKQIVVKFDHKLCGPLEIEGATGITVDDDRRCSLATVIMDGYGSAKGMSVCHPIDNFCRAVGRKRALADALYPFAKDVRKAVWRAYFESHRR